MYNQRIYLYFSHNHILFRKGVGRWIWFSLEDFHIFEEMSYHIQARRKMLAEGEKDPVPKMPFDQLCSLLADAIKSVPSERVIKIFKQTL